jgi:hydroxypyruvate isomerase
MNRRRFLETAGFLAATLETQAQSPSRSASKIKTTVVLDILGGTIDQQIEIAAKAGIESLQMLAQYQPWTDADVDRVKKLCDSHRFAFDGLLAQMDWKKRPVSIVDPAHRENFLADVRHAMGLAEKLGAKHIMVNSGLSAAGKSYEEQYASLREGVKQAGDVVAKQGYTLLLEPLNSLVDHPGCFLTSCVEGLKLVREVNHPNVRLLYDIYHEQVQRGNVIRTLTEAAPYVAVFHVADNPGRNDPGTGEINYVNVFRAIQKTGFSGYIGMEYRPLGDPVASLTKAVQGMRTGLEG